MKTILGIKKYLITVAIVAIVIVCFASFSALALAPLRGDGSISLYNLHLGEAVSVRYRNPDGSYDKHALEEINHVLRCRQTFKIHDISAHLIELVDAIQDHFGAKQVDVVSGYRSPELNLNLKHTGHHVADKSLHMQGIAMDIRIPGVSTSALRQFAYGLHSGGVGYYPHDGFVHVDVGPVRTW